jgi:transposase
MGSCAGGECDQCGGRGDGRVIHRNNPKRLYADRGYDYDKYRRLLRKRGIKPLIARRGIFHGSGLGKIRWVVERTFAWLHQFKRLRIRYEHRTDLHQALLELACSIICLRSLRRSLQKDRQGDGERR